MWIKAQNKTLVNADSIANIYILPKNNEFHVDCNFVGTDRVTVLGIYQTRPGADNALNGIYNSIDIGMETHIMPLGGDSQ